LFKISIIALALPLSLCNPVGNNAEAAHATHKDTDNFFVTAMNWLNNLN
jgi:hypothetical protein